MQWCQRCQHRRKADTHCQTLVRRATSQADQVCQGLDDDHAIMALQPERRGAEHDPYHLDVLLVLGHNPSQRQDRGGHVGYAARLGGGRRSHACKGGCGPRSRTAPGDRTSPPLDIWGPS